VPYEEDIWKHLSIGKIRFVAAEKSSRCALTTVDQETGKKGTEPLRTLSGYRKFDSKIYFGHNLISLNEGEVTVGDGIVSRRDS
ncbi:MAG: MOSC domain-containing protein, partial [Wenzhouxiangellaceae bacterium]